MGDGGIFGGVFGGGGGPEWTADDIEGRDAGALEDLVAALLSDEGYTVERAAPNAEGGIRLLARKGGLIGSDSLVVAVSPATQTVTPASVRQLERARGLNGADRALLVRPTSFPDPIYEARDTERVTLVDGGGLTTRLTRSGLTPPDPDC